MAGLPVARVSGWYGPHLVTTVSVLLLFESIRENQPNYYGYSIMHLLVLICEHVYGSLSWMSTLVVVSFRSTFWSTLLGCRWRVCFLLSTIPAVMLALGMEKCAESPRWLFKVSQCLMLPLTSFSPCWVLLMHVNFKNGSENESENGVMWTCCDGLEIWFQCLIFVLFYLFSNASFSKRRMSMLDFGALNMWKLPCLTLPVENNKIKVELLGKL